ncbi:family 43 glycosylhydrolase [Paenibacillus sp. MSJ-34]|uniref:family 43 glycosylhydrolase n=1 Tax=Paenibacillus sp. MSJ-34 TaxID=2841529 RepID=UPI0020A10D7C|nr:family 43 glycosylhydrolase [Paenibacillus sp. MSJ-34]
MAKRTFCLRKIVWLIGLAAALVLSGCDSYNKPEEIDLSVYERMHANPYMSLEQEWEDYGNGDPFVLRHDGRYYLYVSTKDFRVGMKAWVSDNLIDWRYAGLVTEDPISTGAYAPEVVYWNGYFYLYTSPAGKGHYVFRSESPTGPFERISENVGMSIDGSVFIDDDGSWTFTHAGPEGIVGVPMDGPASFGFGSVIPETFLGHWTEGSMIIKRNGTYYMTFTGNHVFSKGYRIHYAVAKESPLGPYRVPANNPLAISTKADFFGLGHNSIVMGPDLDSYYLVYHNLVGRSAEGPPVRQMNIDRLVFNGDKMNVLGPTHYDQPVPQLAAFAGRLDEAIDPTKWDARTESAGGAIVSKESTHSRYTAEFNLRMSPGSSPDTRIVALFGYVDDANFAGVEIGGDGNGISLISVSDGARSTLAEAELPAGTDLTKLHTIRVELGEGRSRIYFDGGLKIEAAADSFGAGKIGYRYEGGEPILSYTAFSNHVNGSSDFESVKPLPGTIEAAHYLMRADRGYSVKKHADSAAWRTTDGVDIREAGDGSYSVALHDKGDWLRYTVNVSESGTYAFDLTVKPSQEAASIELLVDDRKVGVYQVPGMPPTSPETEWARIRAGRTELDKGLHTVAVKLHTGRLEWKTMDFDRIEAEPFRQEQVLEQSSADDVHGIWQKGDAGFLGAADADSKMYGGSPLWSDYRIETTVKLGDEPSGQAGALIRVTNESDFPHQVKDSLTGYFLAVSANKIELYKHNYDSVLLHAEKVALQRNESHRLRIDAIGGSIRVYLEDESQPVLAYDDPDALMQGRVGIRSAYAEQIELGDLTVESVQP